MDEFLNSLASRKCSFGLIDPAIVECVPDGLTTQILVPKRLWSSKHLMPILLDLEYLSNEGWNDLLAWQQDASNYLQQPPVAFFVTTHIGADEFARHWNVMQLVQTHPARKFWLRIHDPRVMHQLLRILSPAQRRRLFGRAQAFHYWIGGKWITAACSLGDELGCDGSSAGFAGWDWRRIEYIGVINRALLGAGIHDALEMTRQATIVERLIECAIARHGLTEQVDLVEFAVKGLLTRPTFDEHPVVARAINTTAGSTERTNLVDRFALIEERVWEELRDSATSLTERQI